MIVKAEAIQQAFIGEDKLIRTYRFEAPVAALRQRILDEQRECERCGKVRREKRCVVRDDLYDTPWQEHPGETKYFCSIECEDEHLHERGDFEYFECQECHREICEQNPWNGWHVQYREWGDIEEPICLKCLSKILLEEGTPREKLEKSLFGIFWDDDLLKRAGYELEGQYFVDYRNVESTKQRCLDAHDLGHKVIIGYESMGIGGSEGHIAIWLKKGGNE